MVTVSTSLARGEAADVLGPRLVELCRAAGLEVTHEVVSDDRAALAALLRRLIDATGALRLHHGRHGHDGRRRDPEATRDVIERDAPGYAEAIRAESRDTPRSGILTRGCPASAVAR